MTHTYVVRDTQKGQDLKTLNGQGCSLTTEMLWVTKLHDIHSYAKEEQGKIFGDYSKNK